MGFTQAIASCFSNYFNFSGRALRSEFWFFTLFLFMAGLLLSLASDLLYGLFVLGTFMPSLAVQVRRLHDTDHSGWHILAVIIEGILAGVLFASEEVGLGRVILLVGIVHSVVILIWLIQRGDDGDNRYGVSHQDLDIISG